MKISESSMQTQQSIALPRKQSVLERSLARSMGHCIADFNLIEAQDRVMVCLSGGKDSYALLHLLERARQRAPVAFELIVVHVDQGQPGYDGEPLERWLQEQGFEYHILKEDTYSVVIDRVEEGKTYCALCSRLRRGILYTTATKLGCTKIALGHHRDDTIETLLLNMFFAGSMRAMPARLVSDDQKHVVIRPLLYAAESDIAAFAKEQAFPILPCNLCGSQDNLRRAQIKRWLKELEQSHPGLRQNMLAALGNIKAAHLLDTRIKQEKNIVAKPGHLPVVT
ncbi:MAG: tRNA 2-thiocytidine(32) synthetase TtcA [Myxococcales bacterium]|nr:MAG: tRNA 2-thiocytidine(32) synthetase TtcA [Myxococcales bacterium]